MLFFLFIKICFSLCPRLDHIFAVMCVNSIDYRKERGINRIDAKIIQLYFWLPIIIFMLLFIMYLYCCIMKIFILLSSWKLCAEDILLLLLLHWTPVRLLESFIFYFQIRSEVVSDMHGCLCSITLGILQNFKQCKSIVMTYIRLRLQINHDKY